MSSSFLALRLVEQEVAGLMQRMAMVRPFALQETMVPAAAPFGTTLRRIDDYLASGRRALLGDAGRFLGWLRSGAAAGLPSHLVYRRYVLLRLQANASLTQFDLFADALTQRSEAAAGIWLAGLDRLAIDALTLPQRLYEVPPLICYLDRGVGAAIRRARTRLPGGGENPVAVIRVPRERMVGLGIASSLVHETGHQAAALLDLVPLLRERMAPMVLAPGLPAAANPWHYWHRWISEIVADLWSVARLGVASTLGLMNVVSLPRVFVFRTSIDDPHPTPWVRVLISAAIGARLYPHPQWARIAALWHDFYPNGARAGPHAQLAAMLAGHVDAFAQWLLAQPLAADHGRSLALVLRDPALVPDRLEESLERWQVQPDLPERWRPCQVFAVAGYAKLNRGRMPEPEGRLLSRLLTRWALDAPRIPALN